MRGCMLVTYVRAIVCSLSSHYWDIASKIIRYLHRNERKKKGDGSMVLYIRKSVMTLHLPTHPGLFVTSHSPGVSPPQPPPVDLHHHRGVECVTCSCMPTERESIGQIYELRNLSLLIRRNKILMGWWLPLQFVARLLTRKKADDHFQCRDEIEWGR